MKKRQLAVSIMTCFALFTFPGDALAQETKKAEKGEESTKKSDLSQEKVIEVQALLDRAGFSPGEIDGEWGKNVQRAMAVFQQANNLPATEEPDDATLQALKTAAGGEAVVDYQLTEEDVAGPFTPDIPKELPEQAKLKELGYRNTAEALGEKFHIEPDLLKSINKDAQFKAGETIRVPNVTDEPPQINDSRSTGTTETESQTEVSKADADSESKKDGKDEKDKKDEKNKEDEKDKKDNKDDKNNERESAAKDSKSSLVVTVSKGSSTLTVTNAGRVVFHAPVTSGSEHDPLPLGEWKVNGVERNPPFNYNPDLFWDAKSGDEKAKIPPGPNNPVGRVWVDITKEHYGLHGTPEPGKIGYTESHGCVRLTNWDAMKLAALVKKGTKVVFTE